MNTNNEVAFELLRVLAKCNTRLSNLFRQLRSKEGVKSGVYSLEVRENRKEPIIEGYVDIELSNGKSMCWYLEVSYVEAYWEIQTSIRINDSQGPFVARAFIPQKTDEFGRFLSYLDHATKELVASAGGVDLIEGRVVAL